MTVEVHEDDVTVAGLRTYYWQAGKGPVLLLLHGQLPGSCVAVEWGDQVRRCAEAGFSVYALDVPGYRQSRRLLHRDAHRPRSRLRRPLRLHSLLHLGLIHGQLHGLRSRPRRSARSQAGSQPVDAVAAAAAGGDGAGDAWHRGGGRSRAHALARQRSGHPYALPLPRLADFENDDLYIRRITTDVWPCSYFDLLENATDLVHTEYLHWRFGYKTSGNLDWRESDWGMIGRFERSIGTGDEAIYNRSYFHMPTAAEFAQIGRPGFPGIFYPRLADSTRRRLRHPLQSRRAAAARCATICRAGQGRESRSARRIGPLSPAPFGCRCGGRPDRRAREHARSQGALGDDESFLSHQHSGLRRVGQSGAAGTAVIRGVARRHRRQRRLDASSVAAPTAGLCRRPAAEAMAPAGFPVGRHHRLASRGGQKPDRDSVAAVSTAMDVKMRALTKALRARAKQPFCREGSRR